MHRSYLKYSEHNNFGTLWLCQKRQIPSHSPSLPKLSLVMSNLKHNHHVGHLLVHLINFHVHHPPPPTPHLTTSYIISIARVTSVCGWESGGDDLWSVANVSWKALFQSFQSLHQLSNRIRKQMNYKAGTQIAESCGICGLNWHPYTWIPVFGCKRVVFSVTDKGTYRAVCAWAAKNYI